MRGRPRPVGRIQAWAWLTAALWLASCGPGPGWRAEDAPNGAGAPVADGGTRGERGEGSGRVIAVSGPETAGSVVVIRGRKVRLPPDAYVSAYYVTVDCVPRTPCPDPPVQVIQRSGAEIVLEQRTGLVWSRSGPAEAWTFLRGIVRGGDGVEPGDGRGDQGGTPGSGHPPGAVGERP